MRRELHFNDLDDAVAECRRLLRSDYVVNGKWTLGQICQHLRLTIEANQNGYPKWMTVLGYPLRPLLRTFMLPRLLSGNSPTGIKTAPMFVPKTEIDDSLEVEEFARCVSDFLENKGPLHSHPGFGNMSHNEFNAFHAAHAAHHLSFLDDAESLSSSENE